MFLSLLFHVQPAESGAAAACHRQAGGVVDRQADLQPHSQAQHRLQDQRLPSYQGQVLHQGEHFKNYYLGLGTVLVL